MDWIWVISGIWLGHYLIKRFPSNFATSATGPVRTARRVRKAYKQNLRTIDRLPLEKEEREVAREAARQKMLRDLDELMS